MANMCEVNIWSSDWSQEDGNELVCWLERNGCEADGFGVDEDCDELDMQTEVKWSFENSALNGLLREYAVSTGKVFRFVAFEPGCGFSEIGITDGWGTSLTVLDYWDWSCRDDDEEFGKWYEEHRTIPEVGEWAETFLGCDIDDKEEVRKRSLNPWDYWDLKAIHEKWCL